MKIKNTMKYHFIPLDCLWAPETSMRLQAESYFTANMNSVYRNVRMTQSSETRTMENHSQGEQDGPI